MRDKAVWVKWMELRVHGEAEAMRGPTGWLPAVRGPRSGSSSRSSARTTRRQQYVEQFTIRIPENLAKLDRIEKIYRQDVSDTPPVVLETLAAQRQRLEELRKAKGDYVSPEDCRLEGTEAADRGRLQVRQQRITEGSMRDHTKLRALNSRCSGLAVYWILGIFRGKSSLDYGPDAAGSGLGRIEHR